jgi:hypothetical protein
VAYRFGRAVPVFQEPPQKFVGLAAPRHDSKGLAIAILGLCGIACFDAAQGKIQIRLGEIGMEADGGLKFPRRPGVLAEERAGDSEEVMDLGEVRIPRQELLGDPLQGGVIL